MRPAENEEAQIRKSKFSESQIVAIFSVAGLAIESGGGVPRDVHCELRQAGSARNVPRSQELLSR